MNLIGLMRGEGNILVSHFWEPKPESLPKSKVEEVSAKAKLSDGGNGSYNRTVLLPILTEISAGITAKAIDDFEYDNFVELQQIYFKGYLDNYMVLQVNGNSLEPEVMCNDIMVIPRK